MMDLASRLAVAAALIGPAVLARRSRDRRAGLVSDRTRALLARMRAPGRGLGPGSTVYPRAVRRAVPHGAGQPAMVAYRAALVAAAPERAAVGPGRFTGRGSEVATRVPAKRTAGAMTGATMMGARAAFAVPRLAHNRAAHGGLAARGAVAAPRLATARGDPLVAARRARRPMPHSATFPIAQGAFARGPSHIAGRGPEQGAAPGFHRTVRQPRSAAAAGDVYLDRQLVGYHLAAAITAEQTRAAGRPGISGSAFNSSMAALRPSGAGS